MKTCPRCRQPVLEDDVSCWRCGERLPRDGDPAEAAPEQAGRVDVSRIKGDGEISGDLGDFPRAPLFYGLVTAGLIFALWFILRLLAGAPLVQVSFGDPVPVGYKVVTVADRRFTLDLPREWRTYDKRVDEAALAALLEQAPLRFADGLQPLAREAGEMEVIFAAIPPDRFEPAASPFVLVASTRRLGRLTPAAVAEMALDNGWLPVAEAKVVENGAKSHVAIEMANRPVSLPEGVTHSGVSMLCTQQFVQGMTESLLLSICTPDRTAVEGSLRDDLALKDGIVSSFQFLRRE